MLGPGAPTACPLSHAPTILRELESGGGVCAVSGSLGEPRAHSSGSGLRAGGHLCLKAALCHWPWAISEQVARAGCDHIVQVIVDRRQVAIPEPCEGRPDSRPLTSALPTPFAPLPCDGRGH